MTESSVCYKCCCFPRESDLCDPARLCPIFPWLETPQQSLCTALLCCVEWRRPTDFFYYHSTDSENPSTRQSASCQTMSLIVESTYFALSRCQRAFVHTRTASQRRQDEVMAFATNCCGDEWVASLMDWLFLCTTIRCYVRWVWLYSS